MTLVPRPHRLKLARLQTLRELANPENEREAPCLESLYRLFLLEKREAWLAADVGWVTPTQGAILYAAASARSPLCISQIARFLHCSRPNVSRAVATLERKSYVVRRPDRRDRRRVLVHINRAGRRVASWVFGWDRRLPDALTIIPSGELEVVVRVSEDVQRTLRRFHPADHHRRGR